MNQTQEDRDLNHFQSIPWCAKHLQDPSFNLFPTYSTQYKATTEDALFAETLKTDDTFRATISLYKNPPPGAVRTEEVRWFFTLGPKVNGYTHVCHGGIVATIIDEAMGLLLTLNEKMEKKPTRSHFVTAYLNVTYLKPVPTPSTVLVTVKVKEIKGRKHFFESTVVDGEGAVLAKADSLYVEVKAREERL